jgi:lysophospholipase
MLEGLRKPVILTGSQIPFSELRNDAADNLLGAMTMTAHYPIIREVAVYFAHRLFRGNRSKKTANDALAAFESPNYPLLAEIGTRVRVFEERLLPIVQMPRLTVHRHLDPNVAVLTIFPGMSAAVFRAFLQPPIRGIILVTFGAGNMPNNRPDLFAVLEEAVHRGVIIVNISQCTRGTVTDAYAVGRALAQRGVIPGFDMTVECALAKLSFLLSFKEMSGDRVKALLRESLRGELSNEAH